MLTLPQCPPLLFSFVQLFQYFLCLSAIYCVIQVFRQHLTPGSKCLSLANLTLQYFVTQLLLEYANARRVSRDLFPLGKILDQLPWWSVLLWILICSSLTTLALYRLKRRNTRYVTPQVIKTSLDNLPTALCFSRNDGSVILSNRRMEELCLALTGTGLLNADLLWQAIQSAAHHSLPAASVILRLENTVWNISRKRLSTETGPVWELSAADVSEEYRLIQALEQDNRQLQANAQRMRDYAKQVDRLTTENEILNAKIRIHGETGNLLCAAVHSMGDTATEADREQTLHRWKQTVRLLRTDTAAPESSSFDDLRDTAETIGISLLLEGELPPEEPAARLCEAIAHECLTNTARHAHGNQVILRVDPQEFAYLVRCTNNGAPPSGPVREGGGLSSLRRQLEKHGAVMRIDSCPAFCLTASIPRPFSPQSPKPTQKEYSKNGTDPCTDC